MSNTIHGGPFVRRRGVPTGIGTAASGGNPISRGGGSGMGILALAFAATFVCGGLWATFEMLAQEEARVAVERRLQAEADLKLPMNPGLAARLIHSAASDAYGRCYGVVEAAGWPVAATNDGASAARRMAIAECLRREGTVPR